MKKLKVAIAGYGIVGKRRHFYINEHPSLEVVAICDQNFIGQEFSNLGVTCYKHYKDLFYEKIDILFVCLTNNIAAEVTIAAINLGIHVFCEKPPGMNVAEIEEVIKAEKNNSLIKLKYGFNHRYHDSVREALRIVQSKELGNIINLRGVYGKSRVIPFSGGWRSKREFSGEGSCWIKVYICLT